MEAQTGLSLIHTAVMKWGGKGMSIHLPLLNAMFFIHFTSDHRTIARPFFFLISGYVGNYSLKSRKIKNLKKPIHDYLYCHGINVLVDGVSLYVENIKEVAK